MKVFINKQMKKEMKKDLRLDLKFFNYDFLKYFKVENINLFYGKVTNELIIDCSRLELLMNTINEDERNEYMSCYISKYAFIILHLEQHTYFEKCAEIMKSSQVLICDYFKITESLFNELIGSSINNYKKMNEENEK